MVSVLTVWTHDAHVLSSALLAAAETVILSPQPSSSNSRPTLRYNPPSCLHSWWRWDWPAGHPCPSGGGGLHEPGVASAHRPLARVQTQGPAVGLALATTCACHGGVLDCLREDMSCLSAIQDLGSPSLEAMVTTWLSCASDQERGPAVTAMLKDPCRYCGKLHPPGDPEGALKRCARCKSSRYCCVDHQKRDWARHKHVCRQEADS